MIRRQIAAGTTNRRRHGVISQITELRMTSVRYRAPGL
jgi:hypothetical protein